MDPLPRLRRVLPRPGGGETPSPGSAGYSPDQAGERPPPPAPPGTPPTRRGGPPPPAPPGTPPTRRGGPPPPAPPGTPPTRWGRDPLPRLRRVLPRPGGGETPSPGFAGYSPDQAAMPST